jgi:glycosyltransferase involved in cell wall biosynthesis
MHVVDWLAIQFMTRVTAHCRDTARKTFVLGVPRSKIQVLLPGYPHTRPPSSEAERRKKRQAAGVRDNQFLLVNAARLAPEKAQDQLLRSFQIIHDRHPHARLWISGTGLDWVERDLHQLRRELRLESCVDFVGFRQDFWSLLDVADLMVHPSHVEGIPQSLMGAMAAGLTIVASDVGGVSEVIAHKRTGLLVKENDVEGFAQAVIGLIEEPQRRSTLAAAARKSIENEHSTATAVRNVEALYREMLAESRRI